MDIAEVQTAAGKLYLFVGIDRTSKFPITQLVDKADCALSADGVECLRDLIVEHRRQQA
jgi:hypothetical protein